jgi:hypothetical protein
MFFLPESLKYGYCWIPKDQAVSDMDTDTDMSTKTGTDMDTDTDMSTKTVTDMDTDTDMSTKTGTDMDTYIQT